MHIIIRLDNKDDLDKKIKSELFFNDEKFNTMAKSLTGEGWMHIIIRLDNKDDLDKKIKSELFFKDEKFNAMAKSLNGDIRKRIVSYLKPADFKPILDNVYYEDNNVSLNSKKLHMIQLLTRITNDYDYSVDYVTKNYRFDLRNVDVRNQKHPRR